MPFYNVHHQRYSVYWYVMTEKEYLDFTDEEKEKQEIIRRITVDAVQPNEQQQEIEHHLKKKTLTPVTQVSFIEAGETAEEMVFSVMR